MAPQLFANDTRVGKRGRGAFPVSLAVHAAAVGGLLLVGGTRVAGRESPAKPPGPVVLRVGGQSAPKSAGTPAPAPIRTHRRQRRDVPAVFAATAPPFVAPPSIPDLTDEQETLADPPENGGGDCPDCVPGVGPVGDGSGGHLTDEPIRVTEHTAIAPRKIHHVQPSYPEWAIKAHLEGDVRIDCTIGPDGRIRDARVLQGPVLLREAALEAVRQWIYTPPRRSGQPVSVLLAVTVRFRIR